MTSTTEYRIVTEENVPATMRDGTTLYADVYRPDAEGRFPVLLLRLPVRQAVHQRLRRPRVLCPEGLRRGHPGHTGSVHVRGHLHPARRRAGRWLRHRGVGGKAPVEQRQGRHHRAELPRRHPVPHVVDRSPVVAVPSTGVGRRRLPFRVGLRRRWRARTRLGAAVRGVSGSRDHRPSRAEGRALARDPDSSRAIDQLRQPVHRRGLSAPPAHGLGRPARRCRPIRA